MRFVQLQMRKKTPFEAIVYYKCGPNFIAKREAVFEFMLKQQSFRFWFRFWLTFCSYPIYTELNTIQNHWPVLISYLNLHMYRNFLQIPLTDRCRYCVHLITKLSLIFPEREKNLKERSTEELFECFYQKLSEFWEMRFAMALCDVFYKWLLSSDMHDKSSQTYWVIPECYLSPDYKPTSLEEFLVDEWREKLFTLLGVDEKKIPWYHEAVLENGFVRPTKIVKSNNADRAAYIKYIKMITEIMILQKKKIKETEQK